MNSATRQSGGQASGTGRSSPRKSAVKKAEAKQSVSPLERWKMVTEAAYYRAKNRGFLGGNPIEDWAEAEKEIDAKYAVDYGKIMMATDPTEMLDQLSKAFSRIHVPGVDLEAVMDAQRKNIEALSNANQAVVAGARDLTKHQMAILQETVDDATAAIREIKALPSAKNLPAKQAELLKKALEKALANMRELAEIAAESGKEAAEIVKGRASESIDELKKIAKAAKT